MNNKHFFNLYNIPVILASQSPRRKEILSMINLDFTVQSSDYEEKDDPALSPEKLVEVHAINKAGDVAKHHKKAWIIGADTIVVIKGEILGKPDNEKEAEKMLTKLSGHTHQVITGYTIINSENMKSLSEIVKTDVTFNELSEDIIRHYLNHYHYIDKAGSYAIQDFSSVFVEKINGCFYNVVGFPLSNFCNLINNKLHTCL